MGFHVNIQRDKDLPESGREEFPAKIVFSINGGTS